MAAVVGRLQIQAAHFKTGEALQNEILGERRGQIVDAFGIVVAERQTVHETFRLYEDAYSHCDNLRRAKCPPWRVASYVS
jgi:hypothetical protein